MSDTLEQTPRASRGGRPRVTQPLSLVSIRIPTTEHDRLISIALRRDVSVSSLARQLIVIGLKGK